MEFLVPSRTHRPSDDPIFALNAEASARRAKGESIVNATVGALLDDEGRLAVFPTVAQAMREVPPLQFSAYAPLAGPKPFLDAVVGELFQSSPLAEHAVAVATPGGTGALRHAVASYLEPGHALLTSSSYWGPYKTIAEENDRRVETYRMFAEGPEWSLDVAALDAALVAQIASQGRALVFLNDPCHNPTGYSMREGEWRAVVDVVLAHAKKAPVTLLVDVAYYLYGSGDPRAFLEYLRPLVGVAGLLFAWSGSKSFALYGARIGAIVVVDSDAARRGRARDALSFASRGTWSNCNHLGMLAVTKLLTDAEARTKVDAERAASKRLLDRRVEAFNAAARGTSLRYPRYDGGFFTTVFLPAQKDAQKIALALKERGVFVVPQGAIGGALRVALCSVAERDVPRLVAALDEAIRAG